MPPTQLHHPSPKRKRDQPPPAPLLTTALRPLSTPPRGSPAPLSGADSPRNAVADQVTEHVTYFRGGNINVTTLTHRGSGPQEAKTGPNEHRWWDIIGAGRDHDKVSFLEERPTARCCYSQTQIGPFPGNTGNPSDNTTPHITRHRFFCTTHHF